MFKRFHEIQDENGFTLVELLVVIVILGILAGVVVFAVNGITNRGQKSACKTDRNTIAVAEEAHFASERKSYASESDLKTRGFLAEESDLHDVELANGDYTIKAVGDCVGV